jgi:hypothetical protein
VRQLKIVALCVCLAVAWSGVYAQEKKSSPPPKKAAPAQQRPEAKPEEKKQEPAATQQPAGRPAGEGQQEERERGPFASRTFNALRLRSIGPALTSGRVGALAVDPKNRSYCSGRQPMPEPRSRLSLKTKAAIPLARLRWIRKILR